MCSAARDRTSERSDRNMDTTMGITDRRLFDVAQNLSECARSGFSVGTPPSSRRYWVDG